MLSILLPTRKRTELLRRSLHSLLANAYDNSKIEYLLAFDEDDKDSVYYFITKIIPLFRQYQANYNITISQRYGYNKLHHYINDLASIATGDWLFFWNDDAIMKTKNFDKIICDVNKFVVQRVKTHNDHPNTIFPIVPKTYYNVLGHLSTHAAIDCEISQLAYITDIMYNNEIEVDHERYDLTGKNLDSTYEERNLENLEGNVDNLNDFNHITNRNLRQKDLEKLVDYMRNKNYDLTSYDLILQGKLDIWHRLVENDPNKQVVVQYL